ncbi:MAG: DUF2244 domain-containing protein [Rhodospirillales bacterium]|nr:DUF2244 domain-containing protein [Rhodospirillales bacterium]
MDTPIFEAVVTPHRSLGPRGVRLVGMAILFSCSVNATLAWLLGAWPVAIFAAVELGLASYLFRLGARVQVEERLVLTEARLTIQRWDRAGQVVRLDLPTAWLRVALEDRPARVPALVLRGRFRPVEVGGSLGELEKRSLAEALAEAIHELRHPTFDNPQLRSPPGGPPG